MRHMPRRPSLPPSISLSPSLFDVFALPMQMQQCVEKCLRFDLATFLYGQFVTASLPLFLSLSHSLSLPLSFSPSLYLYLPLSFKHFSGIPSSRCSPLLHLNCATCYLSLTVSLSLSHTLVVLLLLLEFTSECSTRSTSAAAAQRAERKTLDTNLNSRARRSRSDACKLLQARAVASLSLTTPSLSPSLPLHVLITSLPATVRANMQIARKIQFVNENAIYYSR